MRAIFFPGNINVFSWLTLLMYPLPSRSSLWKSSLIASSSSLPPFKNSHIARNSDLSKEPFPSETVFVFLLLIFGNLFFPYLCRSFWSRPPARPSTWQKNIIFVENVSFIIIIIIVGKTHLSSLPAKKSLASSAVTKPSPFLSSNLGNCFQTNLFAKQCVKFAHLKACSSSFLSVPDILSLHKVSPTEEEKPI